MNKKMTDKLEEKVAFFIDSEQLLGGTKKVLLAVSGGADSIALLHIMTRLKSEGIFSGDILAAHFNHQLRGVESQRDEEFVVAETDRLEVSLTVKKVDVRGYAAQNKLSIETAGRQLRIESLCELAKAKACGVMVTAHQADDNAETVVQRLARGTGFRGLGGVWPARDFNGVKFVRPLLGLRRREIIDYLQRHGIEWRIDRSNMDLIYRRNFIRHRLLPELQKQCSSNIVEKFSELSQKARGFHNLVCGYVDKVWEQIAEQDRDFVQFDAEKLSCQPEPVKVELIRCALGKLGSGQGQLTRGHFETILKLARQRAGIHKAELPGGFLVRQEYDQLFFERVERITKAEKQDCQSVQLVVPGQTRFGNYLIEAGVCDVSEYVEKRDIPEKTSTTEWFDFNRLKFPLTVRLRQHGDSFVPLGLASPKKVGKFLTAQKVPQHIRKKILIVSDCEQIIWIWPIRMSEKARVTDNTRKVLRLQILECQNMLVPNA